MDTVPGLRRLSSRWTVVPKYIVPLAIAALLGFTIWAAARDGAWWEPVLWGGMLLLIEVYAFAFAWDLCHASSDGRSLQLTGLRASAVVPLADVREVAAFTRSRWPHVDIVLRRPTPLGQEFRIVPRADSLVSGGQAFWETFDLLARHADRSRHDLPEGTPRGGSGTRAPAVLAVTAVVVAAIVTAVIVFAG